MKKLASVIRKLQQFADMYDPRRLNTAELDKAMQTILYQGDLWTDNIRADYESAQSLGKDIDLNRREDWYPCGTRPIKIGVRYGVCGTYIDFNTGDDTYLATGKQLTKSVVRQVAQKIWDKSLESWNEYE